MYPERTKKFLELAQKFQSGQEHSVVGKFKILSNFYGIEFINKILHYLVLDSFFEIFGCKLNSNFQK